MGVAMHDRRISPVLGQRHEARRAVQQRFVEIAPLPRQAVAETVGELLNFFRKAREECVNRGGVAPAPYRYAEAWVVPPMRVEARPGPDDLLALLARRRQGPCRRDPMRVGQVFEKKAPVFRVLVPLRLEASRDHSGRHRGRNLGVERHFLPAAVPGAGQTFGKPGLEDERVRRASAGAIVAQAQSNDLRQNCRPRAFHRDCAHAPVAQRAATAKREREVFAVRGLRQRLCHASA